MLTELSSVALSPEFSKWSLLVAPAQGFIFGRELHQWQQQVRQSLSLPTDRPIIIVGHQPSFFHPGILAKFIAAERLAREIGGVVVFLVIDHHKGNVGTLQTPEGDVSVANIDPNIEMHLQNRVEVTQEVEPYTSSLATAYGENAAMQVAQAVVQLMEPWAHVQHVISASDLMQTSFSERLVSEIELDKHQCVTAYNAAVNMYPEGQVRRLMEGEVPFWQEGGSFIHAKALLITLVARLVACDIFVHGMGGHLYDRAMAEWSENWLDISPCSSTMATATLRLPIQHESFTDARRLYYSPPHHRNKKKKFLESIKSSSYKSPEKQLHFQQMHQWLDSLQPPLHGDEIKRLEQMAHKRDWAFPFYSTEQLNQLKSDIWSE